MGFQRGGGCRVDSLVDRSKGPPFGDFVALQSLNVVRTSGSF